MTDADAAARRARRHVETLGNRRYVPDLDEFAGFYDHQRYFTVYALGRTAPAAAGPGLTHALLGLFPASLVRKVFEWVPGAAAREKLRGEYLAACDAAGQRLFGRVQDAAELADRLETLVDAADLAARPLAAAWADLGRPPDVGARIERAATVLREFRGGAHLSALDVESLVGADALLVFALWRDVDQVERGARLFGWRDDDLAAAWDRLETGGWVDADHGLTDDGRRRRDAIEHRTNEAAAGPWRALAPDERERTLTLLEAAASGQEGTPFGA